MKGLEREKPKLAAKGREKKKSAIVPSPSRQHREITLAAAPHPRTPIERRQGGEGIGAQNSADSEPARSAADDIDELITQKGLEEEQPLANNSSQASILMAVQPACASRCGSRARCRSSGTCILAHHQLQVRGARPFIFAKEFIVIYLYQNLRFQIPHQFVISNTAVRKRPVRVELHSGQIAFQSVAASSICHCSYVLAVIG